ncbi:MAG TPA: hypothetical protein VM056_04275 [Terriglobales bacterium]|nr:hypothetical protein [Terriglobales bacterium]
MHGSDGFSREQVSDGYVRSICKKCGAKFEGTVSKALMTAEWDHIEACSGPSVSTGGMA